MKILFFASLKEQLRCGETEAEIAQGSTARELVSILRERGEPWSSALANERLMVAINQEVASLDAVLQAEDEVAFFPPVTGG